MITLARCFIFACCLTPALGAAQVHKCKAADGSLRYSDQPCPGTAISVGQARAARETTTPPVAAGNAAASGTSQPASAGQPPVPRPIRREFFDSTVRRPPSQRDLEEIKAFKRGVDRMEAEIDDRCRAGDSDYCARRACDSVRNRRGPAEDFKTYARAYNRPVGSNWIAHGGEPEDVWSTPSQFFARRKHSNIYHSLSTLVCLRPAGSSAQVSGEDYGIKERDTREDGRVFELSYRSGQPTPGYSSIEALAAAVCGR